MKFNDEEQIVYIDDRAHPFMRFVEWLRLDTEALAFVELGFVIGIVSLFMGNPWGGVAWLFFTVALALKFRDDKDKNSVAHQAQTTADFIDAEEEIFPYHPLFIIDLHDDDVISVLKEAGFAHFSGGEDFNVAVSADQGRLIIERKNELLP